MKVEDILYYIKSNSNSALFYTPVYYKNAYSYFFKKPNMILNAGNLKELEEHLDLIEEHKNKGFTSYGYIKYEGGYLLENKQRAKSEERKGERRNKPISRFCLFDEKNVIKIKSSKIDFGKALNTNEHNLPSYTIENFKLNTDKETFLKNIEKIKKHISQGDTYQVNYTVKSEFDFSGDISSLFLKLLFNQSARYTAFINDDEQFILSLSPELFFEYSKGKVICKPMKGTVIRGYNTEDDIEKRKELTESKKNRAENVMIVDLERNDLSKISNDSIVKVKKLFETEKYETLYQLTSTIEAKFNKNNSEPSIKEIIKQIFPCGSITGAPKIRTMEIIREIEKEERGLYTGALGIVSKEKGIFNIPIRTISINTKTGKSEMGIGSGIVWDSVPEEEYSETLLKSNFLTNPVKSFYLFETMLIENNSIFLFENHLRRMKTAAEFFLFNYNERNLNKEVSKILKKTVDKKQYRLKLMLDKWGDVNFVINEIHDTYKDVKIGISEFKIDSKNRFQYFKTSNREVYESEHKKYMEAGCFDILFFNEKDELTEGSISNVFIKKNNKWLTPKLNCGLLNGVYRDYFISSHPDCKETILYKEDILNADEIILTNAVRKKVSVSSIVH